MSLFDLNGNQFQQTAMSDYYRNALMAQSSSAAQDFYMQNIRGRGITRDEDDATHNKKDYINEKLLLLIED